MANGEVRTVSSTGAAKGVKPEAFDLIPPGPLFPLARFYGSNSVDFNDADGWSSVFNYVNDHLWNFWFGDDTDPATGLPRLIAAAAGCFALLEFLTVPERCAVIDDRPTSDYSSSADTRPIEVTVVDGASAAMRFDLIPYTSLVHLARHYGAGASKYAAHNWAAGYEWSKPFAALMRHLWSFWDGEDIDEETGSPHIVAAAWHCLTMAEFGTTHCEFDDRPVRGTQTTHMTVKSTVIKRDSSKKAAKQ